MVEPDSHRHGVDEDSDHRFDAGDLWRAPGDGGAEDHVFAGGRAGEHDRPGGLDQGVEGGFLLLGHRDQGRGVLFAQLHLDLMRGGGVAAGAVRGRKQRRLDRSVE